MLVYIKNAGNIPLYLSTILFWLQMLSIWTKVKSADKYTKPSVSLLMGQIPLSS